MNSLQRRPSVRQRIALLREAVRGIWQGPIYSSDPNLREFFGGSPTATGVSVSENSALTHAAVWSAVNCISGDIGALPLNMYRRLTDGGKEKFIKNPLHRLVHDQPNPEMTSIAWRRTVQAHALSWGNGYSEIVRDGAGRPSQLWPITPDRVMPYRRGSDSGLEYRVLNRDGSDSFVPAEDMLHIPGLGFDGVQGYSVIAKARESIGLGMAAQDFGSRLYGNGLAIGGVISYPGAKPTELSDKNYIATLNSNHQGVERAHKLLALYNGAKYERMNIPPNDAQFLETRKFQISEIARWFNLPPHKLGDLERATHSNIEQQTIDYYTGTLLPWLKTWEQELFAKLVPASERNIQFFEHVVDGLLRGDSQMRADAFSKRFNTASVTPNEIRDSENQNPIPGGDLAFVPLNTIPLNLVEEWFKADIEEKQAKAIQAKRPPPEPVAPAQAPASDPAKAREIELLTEARDTARRCAQEAEDAKDVIAADLAAVRVELAHVQAERDAIVAEQDETRQAHAATVADLTNQVTEARQINTQADERDVENQRAIERLTAQATSLGADLGRAASDLTAAVERCAMIEADYQRVCADVTTVTGERDAAIARAEASDRLVTERVEAFSLDLETAQRESASAREQITVLTQERQRIEDERTQAEAVHQATVTELRQQIATSTQDLAATTASLLEATATVGTLEGIRDRDQAALTAADEQVVTQTATVAAMQQRLTATQQAIRGTVVDAANRLIAKETERARKAQGSAAKLGAWVATFYPLHEDYCRAALRPVVRALMTAHGLDASIDRVLDQVVLAHIGESSRQLQTVMLDADDESLAPALERVLRRWEAERAESLADRILKEAS